MTDLVLHGHPLSSCTQKVSIAADELGIALDQPLLNLGDPDARTAHLARWPLGKMPVLVDRGRAIPETSIIIEHLQRHHAPAGASLIPDDPDPALEVRLMDRLCDCYVMTPMQALTGDLLRTEGERDALGVARAREMLATAYRLLDARLADGRAWLAGGCFSMADCAAAPSLFYAVTYVPLPDAHERLADYLERLLARPSVARAIDAARPFFAYYPGRAGLDRRFFDPDAG